MKQPKVAIYMSCYNHEKYVADAVNSILKQTYPNLELYMVNDSSTDETGKILEQFRDERIHYFDFKENTKFAGASAFLQKLIKNSDADYVACMASDDMWREDKLEKQICFLTEHPEYKACFTWDKIIFSAERNEYRGNKDYSHKENASRFDWLYYFFCVGNCINCNSMFMEKEVFFEIGGVNNYYLQLADYRAWMKLAERYPFYLMKEELVYYRRHEANLSNRQLTMAVRSVNEMYRIYREVLLPMERSTFRRTFYRNLPYMDCHSEEELLAEKFILLLGIHNDYENVALQAAMDIYFDHCEEDDFILTLKNKYYFNVRDFINFTGNGGMLFFVNQLFNKEILPQTEKFNGQYSPAMVLLNAIDLGKVNQATLSKYRYSTLFDLFVMTRGYEEGDGQFRRIKQKMEELRDRGREDGGRLRVLFIIAETSKWNIENGIKELGVDERFLCSVAFVPEREKAFEDSERKIFEKMVPEGVRCVDLYNQEEHCLNFPGDISEETDIIYYVDCLDDHYECGNMLAGYSMGTDHNCILRRDLYENMTRYDVLSMMREIRVYG